MADEGLKVKISGDSSQLQSELKKGSKSVEQFSQDIQASAKVAAAAGAAILAGLGAATKVAIDVESTSIAFENLSSSVGQSSDEILSALQKASAGTVSANNLMLAANRAMVLGVADNTEEFTELMEIARDRARAMGLTIEQAFNDIVTGIGRGSPLILDNLGLVIDQVAANEDYASSLGKTADALTEEEKKQALLNAVLEQGKKTIDENAQSQMTASEAIQALKSSVTDTAAKIGTSFLPMVQDVSAAVINAIDKFQEWREENPKLAEAIDKAALATGGFLLVSGSLLVALPKLSKAITGARNAYLGFQAIVLATNPYLLAAVAAIALIGGVVATAKWKIDELTEAERRNKAIIEDTTNAIKSYTEQIAENEEQLKTETKTLETYQDNLAKAEKSLADLTAERDKALDSMNKTSATIEQLNQLYDQTADSIKKAQEEVDTWTSMVNYQQGIVDKLTDSLDDANDKLEDAQDEYSKATDKVDEYSAALSDLERQINGLSRVRLEGMGEYEDQINAVESEINKTKLAIWEAEQGGGDTTALEAKLAELENQLEGLELGYEAAYSDALYQQSKAAEEALGENTEMSIDDILDQLGLLGEDRAQMEEMLNDALGDQENAGQGVEEAQAVVDAAEANLETAQSTLDLYQGYLDTANANLTALEESATTIFNNIMGITDGQAAILDKITESVAEQESLYDKIKDETLPDLQESISDANKVISQALDNVNNQTNAVNNLIQSTEDLKTATDGLMQLYLVAGAWWMVDTDPGEGYSPPIIDTTTGETSAPIDLGQLEEHATGGLITRPTLLTDIATGRPYGTMAENIPEYIVPEGKMGGLSFSLTQHIDLSGAVVRSDSDIDEISERVADASYKKFTAALASKGIKV